MKTSFLSAAVLFVGLLGAQYSTAQTTSDMIQETVKSEMQTIQEYVKLDVRQRTLGTPYYGSRKGLFLCGLRQES